MSSYIDFHRLPETGEWGRQLEHSWVEHTRLNLAQQYGSERANRIIAGSDPKTQADIARWNSLGRRSAA